MHNYEFFNAEKLLDDILLNVKNRIGRSSNDFLIKCGSSLENIEHEQPNSRLKILDIAQKSHIKLNRLTILSISI